MKCLLKIKLLILIAFCTSCSTTRNLQCDYELVESIPEDVFFPPETVSKATFDVLYSLISNTRTTLDISSFYWTLLCNDIVPKPVGSCEKGEKILNLIIDAAKIRKVNVRIAVNYDEKTNSSKDLSLLENAGAKVRYLDFKRLVGAGVLHTKFMIADNTSIYVGSANMDWRSLTQVKELGVHLPNCTEVARDLSKIFEVYWYLGQKESIIPSSWPSYLSTTINKENPLDINLGSHSTKLYISSSPKQFNPNGRTNDIDAILDVINNAEKFIFIAVMDYSPTFAFVYPHRYWPVIDDALKTAAIDRKVAIRLMASVWQHTEHNMFVFLRSLDAFYKLRDAGRIDVKVFIVPPLPDVQIPFSRVNHNKYMVTDKHAYIGTSNWSADYFVNTGGVAFVANCNSQTNGTNNGTTVDNGDIRMQLERIFRRDWFSNYTSFIPKSIN